VRRASYLNQLAGAASADRDSALLKPPRLLFRPGLVSPELGVADGNAAPADEVAKPELARSSWQSARASASAEVRGLGGSEGEPPAAEFSGPGLSASSWRGASWPGAVAAEAAGASGATVPSSRSSQARYRLTSPSGREASYLHSVLHPTTNSSMDAPYRKAAVDAVPRDAAAPASGAATTLASADAPLQGSSPSGGVRRLRQQGLPPGPPPVLTPRSVERPLLTPPAVGSGARAKQETEGAATLRIGTLDVRVVAASPHPTQARATAQSREVRAPTTPRATVPSRLARGFGTFGLSQA
jgi:hypothetical protein